MWGVVWKLLPCGYLRWDFSVQCKAICVHYKFRHLYLCTFMTIQYLKNSIFYLFLEHNINFKKPNFVDLIYIFMVRFTLYWLFKQYMLIIKNSHSTEKHNKKIKTSPKSYQLHTTCVNIEWTLSHTFPTQYIGLCTSNKIFFREHPHT